MEKQKYMYTIFSETGKRIANQDICRVVEMPEENRCLLVVCDGMGATLWAMLQPRLCAMLYAISGRITPARVIAKRRY
jgi:hypothetical protein